MSDNLQVDVQHVILCDMCPEEDRKPARKTCMKCEISMCAPHLQVHLTTPVLLQTHPLTEPMALCGSTKCPLHGKLLEYYCLDDMTTVCVSCAIEDQHRLHNMKTFSTAHKELLEKLKDKQQALLVKMSDESDDSDENMSLEMWEKNERERLSGRCVRLIEALTNLRDISLNSVQSSVSARMVALKTSRNSMQAAQNETDTFRFLQMYSQVHQDMEKAKAVDLTRGLEPGSARDKLVHEIIEKGEEIRDQADLLWESLLTMVDPDQVFFISSPDLIFEPHCFDQCMSLSEDKRKVFFNTWLGQCSATLAIRSTGIVPNFQRWMVSISKEINWTIGLCATQSLNYWRNGPVFGLSCKNNQLSSLVTVFNANAQNTGSSPHSVVSSELTDTQGQGNDQDVPAEEVVEVFLDVDVPSLSFFRRTGKYQREELTTIRENVDKSDLVPFVHLEMNVQNKKYPSVSQKSVSYTGCSTSTPSNNRISEVVCGLE